MANRFSKYRTNYVDLPNIISGPRDDGSEEEPAAAKLIRDKVARIYKDEPDANRELAESEAVKKRSKHQQFMYELSTSGKDLAVIQTEWHEYYNQLPADEKHQVWQEFYDSQSMVTGEPPKLAESDDAHKLAETKTQAGTSRQREKLKPKNAKQLQSALKNKVTAGGKLQTKHHLQSLFFGLGMGALVVFIFLFSFFNEIFIAPFIQPGRASASTPIIIGTNGVAPTPTPEVIIPKINVQIPVDYNETSTNEAVIENDLEDGVVHYPTTVDPGQEGNTAYFGHSSNNIFNGGKYKFAFVLLHTLTNGDTFYLTYNDKVYVYKVISKTIVSPSDVGVLGPVPGQTATATLITCDPPGTSINRLVVVGQQISPDPSGDTAAPASTNVTTPKILPSDGQTLWGKFIGSLVGKAIVTLIIISFLAYVTRRYRVEIMRLFA